VRAAGRWHGGTAHGPRCALRPARCAGAHGRVTLYRVAIDLTPGVPGVATLVVSGGGQVHLIDRDLSAQLDATYEHRTLPADLVGVAPTLRERLTVSSPGGRLQAVAVGRLGSDLALDFHARLTDAGGATRLLTGSGAAAPRSRVLLTGRLSRRPGHPAA